MDGGVTSQYGNTWSPTFMLPCRLAQQYPRLPGKRGDTCNTSPAEMHLLSHRPVTLAVRIPSEESAQPLASGPSQPLVNDTVHKVERCRDEP